jgi:hypothetical protein
MYQIREKKIECTSLYTYIVTDYLQSMLSRIAFNVQPRRSAPLSEGRQSSESTSRKPGRSTTDVHAGHGFDNPR